MEKKPYSKQEIEEALRKANVPEKLINGIENPDVQKVPPELLDAVSGGGFGWGNETPPLDWPNPVFNGMTLEEGYVFIKALYDAFGFDITVDFCMEYFNFYTNAWEESLRAGGTYYCCDVMWGICWKYGGKGTYNGN